MKNITFFFLFFSCVSFAQNRQKDQVSISPKVGLLNGDILSFSLGADYLLGNSNSFLTFSVDYFSENTEKFLSEETKAFYVSFGYQYGLDRVLKSQDFFIGIGAGILAGNETQTKPFLSTTSEFAYGLNVGAAIDFFFLPKIAFNIEYRQLILIESIYSNTFPIFSGGLKFVL